MTRTIREESREAACVDAATKFVKELEARGYSPDSSTDRHIIDALPDIFDAAVATGLLPECYRELLVKAGQEARGRFGLPGYNDRMSLRRNTICVVRNGERKVY